MDFHHSFYSNLYYKLVFVTLKQIEYIDDVGFFFEDISKRDYYAVDDIKEVFNFSKQPDGKFLDFAINFGTGKDTVRRNYKRIQSVIAEVGGLFKGIVISSLILKYFFMSNDVYNYLNYFIYNKNISYNDMIKKNFNQRSVLKLNEKYANELSEVNNIKVKDNSANMNLNVNNICSNLKIDNVNNNNHSSNNNNNYISKNINSLYSNWRPENKIKMQEHNIIEKIKNNLSTKELRGLNNISTTTQENTISKDLKFIVMNYLDQKEFLKTVLDLNLLKMILFDDSQNLKFEEMSRDMNFMLQILREKEVISYEVLSAKSLKI